MSKELKESSLKEEQYQLEQISFSNNEEPFFSQGNSKKEVFDYKESAFKEGVYNLSSIQKDNQRGSFQKEKTKFYNMFNHTRSKSVPDPYFFASRCSVDSIDKKSVLTVYTKPNLTYYSKSISKKTKTQLEEKVEEPSAKLPSKQSSVKQEPIQSETSSATEYAYPQNMPIVCPIILPCQYCHTHPYGPPMNQPYPYYNNQAPQYQTVQEPKKAGNNIQLKIKLMNAETENNALLEKIKEVKEQIKETELNERQHPQTKAYKSKADVVNREITEFRQQEEHLFREKEYITKILSVTV